jgi:SAM-dependent methyltransferase
LRSGVGEMSRYLSQIYTYLNALKAFVVPGRRPTLAAVRWGTLRRVTPVSRIFGFDRGQPIDRYYIEQFLQQHQQDIQGRVLEIGDATYTHRFGGARVSQADVLHATPDNPQATLIGDLATGAGLPVETFDCVILTQTLLCIYDVKQALTHLYRILKPQGVVLATVPGISQISRYDLERWGDYWRFTSLAARRLFQEVFPEEHITVATYGNVLAAVAFLHGLAAHELQPQELAYHDPDYEVTIGIRALRPTVPPARCT